MRISAKRKELLNSSLKALNDTVDGNMSDIIKAESEVKKHLPKIGLYLEYGYSCAMKSHFRKSGNQMSGKWKSSNASLLAKCSV